MFLWIDLETTGLYPRVDHILEAGWMVTDENLRGKGHLQSSVVTASKAAIGYIKTSPFIHDMHTKSGLLEALMGTETLVIEDVEERILEAIMDYPEDEPWYLAGASVHFDRAFIDSWMPTLAEKLHHRIFDTSSLKLFAKSVGIEVKQEPQVVQHRVEGDIQYCYEYALGLRDIVGPAIGMLKEVTNAFS